MAKLMDYNEMIRRIDTIPTPTVAKALKLIREGNGARTVAIEVGLSIKETNAVFAFHDYATRAGMVQYSINTYSKFTRHQLVYITDADGRDLLLHWDKDLRKLEYVSSISRSPRESTYRHHHLKPGSSEFSFWAGWARRHLPS